MEFYVGSVTRAHDDVDIAVWLHDLPRIAELLDADGWRHALDPEDDGGTGYEHGPVRLELTFLVRDGEAIFTPLRDRRARWSGEAIGDDWGELNGVPARLVARASLISGKSRPRDEPAEAAKDRPDFELLSARR